MKPIPSIPSSHDFCASINVDDVLTSIIRGHQAIETALTHALSEALPAPHALELARLSFSFKIDLALAMQVLRSDSRPMFQKLNQVRNRFAHSPNTQFGETDARDLQNCLSKHQRAMLATRESEADPFTDLRECMAIAFVESASAVTGLRTSRHRREAMSELIRELLAGGDVEGDIETDLARRVGKKRAES